METMYVEIDDDIQLVRSFRKLRGNGVIDYITIYTKIKELAESLNMHNEKTASGKPIHYQFWRGTTVRGIELFSDFIPVWPYELIKYDYVQICIYGKKIYVEYAIECLEKCSEILHLVGMEDVEL